MYTHCNLHSVTPTFFPLSHADTTFSRIVIRFRKPDPNSSEANEANLVVIFDAR